MIPTFLRTVLIVVVLINISVPFVSAAPAIEIAGPVFDFGKVTQHTDISHTFWIKSVGTDTLRILKVEPGCGCTKAPLRDSVLAPGDSTDLEIIFSTRSYRGYVSKKPYLETNIGDEDEDRVFLKIQAELIPNPDDMTPIHLKPYQLDVSQFTQKPRRKAHFKIINVTDQTYEITPVDTSYKYFDVELPKKIGPGETVEGTVIVHDDALEKEFYQSITFELNDDGNSRFSLPVQRKYRPNKKN